MAVLSLLSILRLEIQLLPSKDLQLEESLRKQGRSKGGYFDWPFPAPTPCARNSKVAISALLLTSGLPTPHSPWASRGGGEKKSSNATKENVPTSSYSLLLRSSPTLWCKPGGWWVYVEHLHSFSTAFFMRLCPPQELRVIQAKSWLFSASRVAIRASNLSINALQLTTEVKLDFLFFLFNYRVSRQSNNEPLELITASERLQNCRQHWIIIVN